MPTYTKLSKTTDWSKDVLRGQVGANLMDFFKWAFMEAGAWSNVAIKTPGTTNSYDLSKLYPLQKDGVLDGKIWQSQKMDWCYEHNLESGLTPTIATSPYINGVLKTSGFYLDFNNGRVVFDTAIPTASLVQLAYSYRTVHFYDSSVPWFHRIILDSFLEDQASQDRGGILAVLNDYRIQTPLIVFEVTSSNPSVPLEMGSTVQRSRLKVLMHIMAEDDQTLGRLIDAIEGQKDTWLFLYDVNARRAANNYPLDWKGSLVAGAKTYPELVSSYKSKTMRFYDVQGTGGSLLFPLFMATVSAVVETEFTSV